MLCERASACALIVFRLLRADQGAGRKASGWWQGGQCCCFRQQLLEPGTSGSADGIGLDHGLERTYSAVGALGGPGCGRAPRVACPCVVWLRSSVPASAVLRLVWLSSFFVHFLVVFLLVDFCIGGFALALEVKYRRPGIATANATAAG